METSETVLREEQAMDQDGSAIPNGRHTQCCMAPATRGKFDQASLIAGTTN